MRALSVALLVFLLASSARAQKPGDAAPAPPEAGLVGVPGFPASGIPGQTVGDDFGYAVSSAGDVNGDGFADLIVGAPFHDANGTSTGRAYVYFGGPLADTTPDLVFTGETGFDTFGRSVAGGGDLNGDGYDDVVVGADFNDAGGADAGRAYVYFGGPGADAVADLVLTGGTAGDRLGTSVSGAGDVNGDGFADLIVGAYTNDAGGTDAGQAYVYFGGPGLNAVADLTLTGEAADDEFGRAVSGAGDVNGDGFADVIVGAALNDAGGTSAGRAYVFFGGASPDAVADLTLTGEALGDQFGYAVSGAGDVDGDGFDDVVVGANANDAAGSNAGRAYVYHGGTSPDAVADLTLTGEAANDQFGRSVAGAGDVNGDSYADVIVGAHLNDAGGSNAGRAYVYFGGPGADATPDITVAGDATGENLGSAVAGTGDVDGDGLADLLVGAINADTPAGASTGAAYVYSNANTGDGVAEWQAYGEADSDLFGGAVAGAGDVNGDGFADVIVGAFGNDAGGTSAGRAYVFFGGPGADATPDLVLTGVASNDYFGESVSGAGDVNGDGYADVIVGAIDNGGGTVGPGYAYVYYGGPTADAIADLVFMGEQIGDFFGGSVSGAGDVNGDGYADVIVGASDNNVGSSSAGQAYVFFGGPSADTVPDLTFNGEAALDRFGGAVSGAGDINGDGYADVVVGANVAGSGSAGPGRAYLYYGGPGADTEADLVFEGEAEGNLFGGSVSGAGDVNADGYDDLIIGATANSGGGLFAGRAYVFYGGPGADAVPDLVFTGEASLNRFGAVSGGGDVNGDGYADVIVGASGNGTGGGDAGRAYVFFGGPSVDTVADLIYTGGAPGDRLGTSVSDAGDTNGDGRADVIVGASGNDVGGSSAGAAYLYRATGPASAPGLYRLADVPGDQGGVLHARWTRSDQETLGNASNYLVQRSQPAGTTGYAWETVATVPGSMEPRYSLTVPTYSDQTGTNPGTTCVRVTAQGANGETWRSMVSCAASIDNLAPGAPASMALAASPDGDVALTWDEVTGEPDLFGYDVFRSSDATCDASDPLAGSASGAGMTAFEDDGTVFGTTAWYCVAARDVHGNRSAVTEAANANPFIYASVKVVLEGAYQSGLPGRALMRSDLEDVLPMAHPFGGAPWHYAGTEAINPRDTSPANGRPDVFDQYDVVDWVLVGVRASAAEADGARAAALLLSDGSLLNPSTAAPYAAVKPVAAGAYHVVVYHRSHLAAMSAFAVALDGTPPASAYDLSVSPVFVYGAGVTSVAPGVYGLFAGDGDANGSVLAPDQQAIWRPSVGLAGYLPGDFNLDGSVLADDQQVLWVPNVGQQSAVPGASSVAPRPGEPASGDR